jgi:hypothetical protein
MATTNATGLRSAIRAAAAETRRVPVVEPDHTTRTRAAVARNTLLESSRTTVQLERKRDNPVEDNGRTSVKLERKRTIESGGASFAETSGIIEAKPLPTGKAAKPATAKSLTASGSSPQLRRAPQGTAPVDGTVPERRRARITWLGVVVTPPELGASLMIGTWLRPEFRVTSPVTRVVPRHDGVLVQTSSKTCYFVKHAGDTYLVQPRA